MDIGRVIMLGKNTIKINSMEELKQFMSKDKSFILYFGLKGYNNSRPIKRNFKRILLRFN